MPRRHIKRTAGVVCVTRGASSAWNQRRMSTPYHRVCSYFWVTPKWTSGNSIKIIRRLLFRMSSMRCKSSYWTRLRMGWVVIVFLQMLYHWLGVELPAVRLIQINWWPERVLRVTEINSIESTLWCKSCRHKFARGRMFPIEKHTQEEQYRIRLYNCIIRINRTPPQMGCNWNLGDSDTLSRAKFVSLSVCVRTARWLGSIVEESVVRH